MIMADVDILRAACCVAGINGEVTDHQREALRALARRVGVGAASLQAMIDRALADKRFFEEQFDYEQKDPEGVLVTLWKVAAIDGRVSQDERELLTRFAQKLRVAEDRMQELIEQAKQALQQGRQAQSPAAEAPLSEQTVRLDEQNA